MHKFIFTDRKERVIPVWYYIAGDFSIGVDEDPEADGTEDEEAEDDVDQQEPEPQSPAEVAGDEEPEDFEFEKECLQLEAATISQSILFVCHGVLRNAEDYCRNWIKLAERFNLMIVCPEFTTDAFPDTKYNFGGVDRQSKQRTWAFTSIEYIFDAFLLAGLRKDGYTLFGHSAGAQFAHRFVLFSPPGSRCLQIVSANAGWYTMPALEAEHKWPYSLNNCPTKFTNEQLEVVFSRKLLVLLGQEDVGLKYLRVEPGAMAQGANRFERGFAFFSEARRIATKMGFRFNWSLRTVPNVGHSNKHMAFIAASHLFSVSRAHRPESNVIAEGDEGDGLHEDD
jgi:pimeloyl-ACP methyl ester carboxylesterase